MAVLIISLTAVMTAWTTFQSAKWAGAQDLALAEAQQTLQLAESAYADAREEFLADVTVFNAWFAATINGEEALADAYEERFPESLAEAFDEWLLTDPFTDPEAPGTPFEEYDYEAELEGDELDLEVDELTDDARVFNQRSDNYTAMAIVLATVILFAALSDKVPGRRSQAIMLTLAGVGLVASIVVVATFPVLL